MRAIGWLLLARQVSRVYAQVFNCVGGSVYVVAHPDDDLFFQSPDLLRDVQNRNCVTTIFLTSGDSGLQSGYAQNREYGNEASTAYMAGVEDTWTEFNATFGGQPVVVRTLVAEPEHQKVYYRLPDGGVEGYGFSSTGYQSLRSLYFNTIPSITNQPRTSTYSLSALRSSLQQILTARQPERIRTLDYLSDFDGGDHSDHLTTGRLMQGLARNVAGLKELSGYMGYPAQNLAPNVDTSSAAFREKVRAYEIYGPYDPAVCQTYNQCLAQGRGEAQWLRRQYVVTPELATQAGDGDSAQEPTDLPSGENVALRASARASSVSGSQRAEAVINGRTGGYPGDDGAEWSSNGEREGAMALIYWDDVYEITAVVLYDRPNVNDWITGGRLTFSDFSSVPITALNNDGSPTVFTLPSPVRTSSIMLTVTSVGGATANIGLSEFAAYGSLCPSCEFYPQISNIFFGILQDASDLAPNAASNLALRSFATASSSEASFSRGEKAIDGYAAGWPEDETEEWASRGEGVGAWLQLNWTTPQTIRSFTLFDRPNDDDWCQGATLSFDGGAFVDVPSLNNDGSPVTINLDSSISTSSVRFVVTAVSSRTANIGLAELQAFAAASADSSAVRVAVRRGSSTTTTSSTSTSTSSTSTSSSSSSTSTTSSTSSQTSSTSSGTSTSAAPTQSPGGTYSRVNLAFQASISASSEASGSRQWAARAIDGAIGGYVESGGGDYTQEWSTTGQKEGATLRLTWTSAVQIARVVLYDRPNRDDQITSGTLTFSDGSTVPVGALDNTGGPSVYTFAPKTTTSLVFTVTGMSATSHNAGLSEIQCYGLASSPLSAGPGPLNLARYAVATGTTSAANQSPAKAIDGLVGGYTPQGGDFSREWATSSGEAGTTFTLTWPYDVVINQLRLYDRPNLNDHLTSGTIAFSGGQRLSVGSLPNDGSALSLSVASVRARSLTLTVNSVDPTTHNVGLAEIEVFGAFA